VDATLLCAAQASRPLKTTVFATNRPVHWEIVNGLRRNVQAGRTAQNAHTIVSMSRVIFMCGPAGSGKSTVARRLEGKGMVRALIRRGGVAGGTPCRCSEQQPLTKSTQPPQRSRSSAALSRLETPSDATPLDFEWIFRAMSTAGRSSGAGRLSCLRVHPAGERQAVRSTTVNPIFVRFRTLGDRGAAVAAAKETPRSSASESRWARSAV
jgi:hypothetical protein